MNNLLTLLNVTYCSNTFRFIYIIAGETCLGLMATHETSNQPKLQFLFARRRCTKELG